MYAIVCKRAISFLLINIFYCLSRQSKKAVQEYLVKVKYYVRGGNRTNGNKPELSRDISFNMYMYSNKRKITEPISTIYTKLTEQLCL